MISLPFANTRSQATQHCFLATGLTCSPKQNGAIWCYDPLPEKMKGKDAPYQHNSILSLEECFALVELCNEFAYDTHLWHRISIYLVNLPNQSRFKRRTYLNVTALAEQLTAWVISQAQRN